MYQPKYKYSHTLVKSLCQIHAFLSKFEEVKVDKESAVKRRELARVGAVTDICRMEGAKLTFDEVNNILSGKAQPVEEKCKLEVLNCKEAFTLVDKLLSYSNGKLNDGDLKWLNQTLLQNIPKTEWHLGKYREIQNWVVDVSREEIAFTPPSPEAVAGMMNDFIRWQKDESSREIHPVVRAGIAHFHLMYIHPFVSGNEKIAFLLSLFVLFSDEINPHGWVKFTDFFADHPERYYEEMLSGLEQNHTREGDLTQWLEYFAKGVKSSLESAWLEFRDTRQKVESRDYQPTDVSSITTEVQTAEDSKFEPNERQFRILKLAEKYQTFHRRDVIEELGFAGKHNPKTISRDLSALVASGLLKVTGLRKGTRYSLKK